MPSMYLDYDFDEILGMKENAPDSYFALTEDLLHTLQKGEYRNIETQAGATAWTIDIPNGDLEVQLMHGLSQLVDLMGYGLEPQDRARATAWLAAKHKWVE